MCIRDRRCSVAARRSEPSAPAAASDHTTYRCSSPGRQCRDHDTTRPGVADQRPGTSGMQSRVGREFSHARELPQLGGVLCPNESLTLSAHPLPQRPVPLPRVRVADHYGRTCRRREVARFTRERHDIASWVRGGQRFGDRRHPRGDERRESASRRPTAVLPIPRGTVGRA